MKSLPACLSACGSTGFFPLIKSMSKLFLSACNDVVNVYGDGGSADKIVDVLVNTNLTTNKKFVERNKYKKKYNFTSNKNKDYFHSKKTTDLKIS